MCVKKSPAFALESVKNCMDALGTVTTVEEMDEAIITKWNAVVRDMDDVYIIGDLRKITNYIIKD